MVGKGLKAGYRACVGHQYGGGRCVSTDSRSFANWKQSEHTHAGL